MIILASSDAAVRERWSGAVPDGSASAQHNVELAALLALHPAPLLLLDLELAGLGGMAAAAGLIGRHTGCRTVIMSRSPNEDEGIAALRAGARGYCNLYIDPRLLAKVISTVQAGEVWAGRKLIDRLVQMIVGSATSRSPSNIDTAAFDALTPREREIAMLVGEGVSNKIIARRLDITERTVKAHLGAVFSKLGIPGRLQLALLVTGRAERASAARTGPH